MRIFLLWADRGKELAHLMRALNTAPNRLVYWLGQEGAEWNNQPGTIFHSHSDAANGIPPANVDTSDFAPPGEEIIRQLYKVESIILTMLNRSLDDKCVDERRHYYYQLLTYWLGVFKKYRPEILIFPVEPHGPYDYLAYELARRSGIRTLCFNETRVTDRLLYMEDFRVGSMVFLDEINKNEGRMVTLEELSEDIREYYKKRAITEKNKTPSYVSFLQNKYSLLYRLAPAKIAKSLREGTIFQKAYSFFVKENGLVLIYRALVSSLYVLRPNLKKEYRALESKPDLDRKYIYAALQVQPERSTSPMGDMFVDQILAIEILAAGIPSDWIVYVKEHPLQWIRIGVAYSSNRYRGYYKRIAALKNVRLIPTETNSYELMERSQTVMTVAGAPGWEAILHGKPCIIFGNPWYKDCPSAFRVNSVESVRDAIAQISEGSAVDQGKVLNFLKCLDDATIHGFIATSNAHASQLTRQENMENITKLILKELKRS